MLVTNRPCLGFTQATPSQLAVGRDVLGAVLASWSQPLAGYAAHRWRSTWLGHLVPLIVGTHGSDRLDVLRLCALLHHSASSRAHALGGNRVDLPNGAGAVASLCLDAVGPVVAPVVAPVVVLRVVAEW